jgi:hypothetical protein
MKVSELFYWVKVASVQDGVIGYAYNADTHCIHCLQPDLIPSKKHVDPPSAILTFEELHSIYRCTTCGKVLDSENYTSEALDDIIHSTIPDTDVFFWEKIDRSRLYNGRYCTKQDLMNDAVYSIILYCLADGTIDPKFVQRYESTDLPLSAKFLATKMMLRKLGCNFLASRCTFNCL